MPLINFGSILGFAEEIENQNIYFLTVASQIPSCSEHKTLFESISESGSKRIKEIQRSRRENITEMILESIEGFYRKHFLVGIPDTADMSPEMAIKTARALLERTILYYEEAAIKLKGQSEVSKTLKMLGKKCRCDLDKSSK